MQAGISLLLAIYGHVHQFDQLQQAPEAPGLFLLQPGHLPLPGGILLVGDMYDKCLPFPHLLIPLPFPA